MYRLAKLANYRLLLAIIFTAFIGLALTLSPAMASDDCESHLDCPQGQFCIEDPTTEDLVCSDSNDFGIGFVQDDLELGDKSLDTAIVDIINLALGFLGLIAVVVILIGGFKWMTAGGNDEKVGEARKWIFSGIIGLAIILSAWAISKFVIDQLALATESGIYKQ